MGLNSHNGHEEGLNRPRDMKRVFYDNHSHEEGLGLAIKVLWGWLLDH